MTTLINLKDEAKLSAIKKAIGGTKEEARKVFDSYETAAAHYAVAAALAQAEGVYTAAASDERFADGSLLPVVGVVGTRTRNAKGAFESGLKAVILFGIPSTDSAMNHSEKSRQWLDKIVEKEFAHIAYRELRNADTDDQMQAAFDSMHTDVDAFVADYRGGDGLDTTAFDNIWPSIRKLLNETMPALVKLLPVKGEVMKAIRSKPYADSNVELKELEANNVFTFLAKAMIKAGADWKDEETGESDPIDTTVIQNWLTDRNTFNLSEPKDFSVLAGLDLLGMSSEEETTTTDTTTTTEGDQPTGETTQEAPAEPAAAAPAAKKGAKQPAE